jgi:hypothetical protein
MELNPKKYQKQFVKLLQQPISNPQSGGKNQRSCRWAAGAEIKKKPRLILFQPS